MLMKSWERIKKNSLYFMANLVFVLIVGKLIEHYIHGGPLSTGHYAAMFTATFWVNYSFVKKKSHE